MVGIGKRGLLPSQVRAGRRGECHQGEAGVRSWVGEDQSGDPREEDQPPGRQWGLRVLRAAVGGQVGRRCLAFRNLEKGSPCLGADAKPPQWPHLHSLQKGLPADGLHASVRMPSLHSGCTSALFRKGSLLTVCLQSGTVLCFIPLVPSSKSLRFRIWVSLRVSFSFFLSLLFFFFYSSTF